MATSTPKRTRSSISKTADISTGSPASAVLRRTTRASAAASGSSQPGSSQSKTYGPKNTDSPSSQSTPTNRGGSKGKGKATARAEPLEAHEPPSEASSPSSSSILPDSQPPHHVTSSEVPLVAASSSVTELFSPPAHLKSKKSATSSALKTQLLPADTSSPYLKVTEQPIEDKEQEEVVGSVLELRADGQVGTPTPSPRKKTAGPTKKSSTAQKKLTAAVIGLAPPEDVDNEGGASALPTPEAPPAPVAFTEEEELVAIDENFDQVLNDEGVHDAGVGNSTNGAETDISLEISTEDVEKVEKVLAAGPVESSTEEEDEAIEEEELYEENGSSSEEEDSDDDDDDSSSEEEESDEDEEDDAATPKKDQSSYLSSLFSLALANAKAAEEHEARLKQLDNGEIVLQLEKEKTLAPLPSLSKPKHNDLFKFPSAATGKVKISSTLPEASEATPSKASPDGLELDTYVAPRFLTKKEAKAERLANKPLAFHEMPAIPEDRKKEMAREYHALKLRNSLDPKRFYKGQGGLKAPLPEVFQLGRIVETSRTVQDSTLFKATQVGSIMQELINDTEGKTYAKRKFSELQDTRQQHGRGRGWKKGKRDKRLY